MEVEKYTVILPKIKKDFRLAVLSDLHLREGSFKNHLEPVLDIVKKMKPTYIILVGDYGASHKAYNNFLNNEAQERFWRYLNELNKIAPIVMSLGNHDVSQGMDKELRKEFFKFERKDIHPVDREKSYYDKNLNINFLGYMQPHDVYSICDMSKKKREAILADIKKYMPKAIKKMYAILD